MDSPPMQSPGPGLMTGDRHGPYVDHLLREARGADALAILFPDGDEVELVTLFRDEREAALFVQARIQWAISECMLNEEVFTFDGYDWAKRDPLTMAMRYRISIRARGRDDANGIGMPQVSYLGQDPNKKRGFLSRLRHPFGGK